MDHLPLQSPAQLLECWAPLFDFTPEETKFLKEKQRVPKVKINLKDLSLHKRRLLQLQLSTQYDVPASLLTNDVAVLENPAFHDLLRRRQEHYAYLTTKGVNLPINASRSELARVVIREKLRDHGIHVPDDMTKAAAKTWLERARKQSSA
jgi:hypothetical protein